MSGEYSVEDKSLLAPSLKWLVWDPLMKVIPRGLSANTMTLAGTALNLAAMTLALLTPASRPGMAVIAILVSVYLCLDNMDGAQARRTGTGSPLGELLDHWLDGINGTFLTLGAVVCWENENLAGLLAIALTATAYSMAFWEQRTAGNLYFGRLGNVEGIFLVILFFIVQAIVGPRILARFPLVFGYSPTDLVVGLTVVTCTFTTIAPLARARRHLTELSAVLPVIAMLAGPAALIAWYVVRDLPFRPVAGLLVLLTPATGGRMLVARLTKRPEVGPDYALILPVIFAAAGAIVLRPSATIEEPLLLALIAYGVARVALDFIGTVRRLAHHIRPGELLSLAFGKRQ